MNDYMKQIETLSQPYQEVMANVNKSTIEVAEVANGLALDLAKTNFAFGLKLFATGEKLFFDALNMQQQIALSAMKTFQGYSQAVMPVK